MQKGNKVDQKERFLQANMGDAGEVPAGQSVNRNDIISSKEIRLTNRGL